MKPDMNIKVTVFTVSETSINMCNRGHLLQSHIGGVNLHAIGNIVHEYEHHSLVIRVYYEQND